MEPNDELCLCFHVTRRKVVNYIRVNQPKRESQLSECFGAGTGCGWCRPFLKKLFQQGAAGQIEATSETVDLPSAQEYSRQRSEYVAKGKGTPPPGATSVEPN